MLDGQVYQLKADGRIYEVDDSEKTPFACVTFFLADSTKELVKRYDYESFP